MNWIVSIVDKVGRGKERLRQYLVVGDDPGAAIDNLRRVRDFDDAKDVVPATEKVYSIEDAGVK